VNELARLRLTERLRSDLRLAVTAVEPLGDAGRSNVHYRVRAGDQRFILRCPPLAGRLPTAHDLAREHAVLTVLWQLGVAVPKPVLYHPDTDVLGVPFLLMSECGGVVARGQWPDAYAAPETRPAACSGLVAALAVIHGVAWRDTALREFDRPEPYASRQLRRLARQWSAAGGAGDLEASVRSRLTAAFDGAGPSRPATILHGDYGPHNVLLEPSGGRVAAILDWELWTVGDPLADLGWLLALWAERGDPDDRFTLLGPLAITAQDGCWTRAQLADDYHRRTGTDLTDLPRYQALALYKLAVIQAGIAHRLRRANRQPEATTFDHRAHIGLRTALRTLG
jgi:aminoglycoside phosphotransferase (APT) family kinase protein